MPKGEASAAQTILDLAKVHRADYISPKTPTTLEIGFASYLTVTGIGEIGDDYFRNRLDTLYEVANEIRNINRDSGQNYIVSRSEAQVWGSDENAEFWNENPETLNWKLMIRTPDFVNQEQVYRSQEILLEKGGGTDVTSVRLETMTEGDCVQLLHEGDMDNINHNQERVREYMTREGLVPSGPCHHVFMTDPITTPTDKMNILIRQPVR